jgi:hypothetical protein
LELLAAFMALGKRQLNKSLVRLVNTAKTSATC